MNEIRESLPNHVKEFFYRLRNYLDTELYFYGSINRSDYIHGQSDIDIAIFTENESSVISKLQHFLHVKKDAFNKVIWKLRGNVIYGYKIKCEEFMDIKCEIAIYNIEYKQLLLEEFKSNDNIPLHLAILIFILKTFHYTIPLISKSTYMNWKVYIFNTLVTNKKDYLFYVIKNK